MTDETKIIEETGSVPSKASDAHRAVCCNGGLRPPKACELKQSMRRSQSAATKRFCSSTFILRHVRYNQRRLNSVLAQTQPVTTQSDRGLACTALAVAALAALWFILCKQLSGEWS